jgi:hypothetical protein
MKFKMLLVVMAVGGMGFYGCAKKPKQVPQASAAAPAVTEQAAAPAAPKSDTGEVFNSDSKNKKVGRTFSMSAEASAESYMPTFLESGRYVVQIAAGPSSSGAEELANAFRGKGYPAYVAEVQNPTPELSGTYYRVRIGCFDMLADAKAFGENILRPANYDYWVDLKANDAVGTGTGVSSEYSTGGYSPGYAPAAAEPAYAPSAPATTTDYGATTSSSTTTSSYDWSTPSATTPSYESSAPTTPSTESSWTTETPAATPPSTDTGAGSWGGSGWQ